MTISLILARPGRGIPEAKHSVPEAPIDTEYPKAKRTDNGLSRKARGGTLIICPMALLGQWKGSSFTSVWYE